MEPPGAHRDRLHRHLTNFDVLYIGGGNSRHVQGDLPDKVRIVSNEAGITGGIRLWDATLDAKFVVA